MYQRVICLHVLDYFEPPILSATSITQPSPKSNSVEGPICLDPAQYLHTFHGPTAFVLLLIPWVEFDHHRKRSEAEVLSGHLANVPESSSQWR